MDFRKKIFKETQYRGPLRSTTPDQKPQTKFRKSFFSSRDQVAEVFNYQSNQTYQYQPTTPQKKHYIIETNRLLTPKNTGGRIKSPISNKSSIFNNQPPPSPINQRIESVRTDRPKTINKQIPLTPTKKQCPTRIKENIVSSRVLKPELQINTKTPQNKLFGKRHVTPEKKNDNKLTGKKNFDKKQEIGPQKNEKGKGHVKQVKSQVICLSGNRFPTLETEYQSMNSSKIQQKFDQKTTMVTPIARRLLKH